jgi:inosose dehydratase
MNRRSFLAATAAAVAASQARLAGAPHAHVATNTYPWTTFAARDGGAFPLHADASLAAIASTGLRGYEPIIESADEVDLLGPRLEAHGLEMRSIYVNTRLHDDAADASIAAVLAIGRAVAPLGTRIVVTNPSPIRWGGPENKTDAQIVAQGRALERLGGALGRMGLTLAYHNHDAELRAAAREFHHMLTATDPAHVKLCLDAHWVFRGASDSQVALFDAVEHYGSRIVELHLRQSRSGRWSEVFTADGDIAYGRLSRWLGERRLQPHLVLEQAIEDGSPRTMDVVAAHRLGLAEVLQTFASVG